MIVTLTRCVQCPDDAHGTDLPRFLIDGYADGIALSGWIELGFDGSQANLEIDTKSDVLYRGEEQLFNAVFQSSAYEAAYQVYHKESR